MSLLTAHLPRSRYVVGTPRSMLSSWPGNSLSTTGKRVWNLAARAQIRKSFQDYRLPGGISQESWGPGPVKWHRYRIVTRLAGARNILSAFLISNASTVTIVLARNNWQ